MLTTCRCVGEIAECDYNLRHVRLSVYPSVRMKQFDSVWTDFHETWCLRNFRTSVEKFKFRWNMTRMTGSLHCVVVISRSVLLIKRNVSDKNCRENQNSHIIFRPLPENRAVYEILWNNLVWSTLYVTLKRVRLTIVTFKSNKEKYWAHVCSINYPT